MIDADGVLGIVDLLDAVGVPAWVDGGWGVDALLGAQSRAHADLDIDVAAGDLPATLSALTDAGYAVTRDSSLTAVVLAHADGREVDVHWVVPTGDGGGDQGQPNGRFWHYGPPVVGHIGGSPVRCCSVDTQVRGHHGYPPDDSDRADMRLLAERFGLVLLPPYGDLAVAFAAGAPVGARERPTLGLWCPLTIAEVSDLLGGAQLRWWIAGGWAIDLHLGRVTRRHGDIDVGVLRRDQQRLHDHLAGWDLQVAAGGTLRPWGPGEQLEPGDNDIWCRPTTDSPWGLQIVLTDSNGDEWVYRRDPRIRWPLSELTRPAWGVSATWRRGSSCSTSRAVRGRETTPTSSGPGTR